MAGRLFLLTAWAAALVAAQLPPDLSTGCTSKSFSIPSWLIRNLERSTGGDVSFSLLNRATNTTAGLACSTEESGWNACSPLEGTTPSKGELEVSVQVTESSTAVRVKQTWTCDDRGTVMKFTAAGNGSAAANYTSPILVRGSLLEPVAITPAYADGPTGHDTPGCTARSEKPSWVLSHVSYTNRTGDGVTATPMRSFNLILTNAANGYEASCMPGTSFDYSADPSHLVCAGEEFQSFRVGRYPISTEASFDEATSTFSLRQTWFCDDHDPAKPLNITATGSAVLPFKCTTEELENGETEKVCVTETDVTVPGKLGTVVTMPPYVIEDPAPARDGCTVSSIFNPRWVFSGFAIVGGAVSFEVILQTDRGFQYPIPIYQGEPTKPGPGWYECDIGADGGNGLPLWPYECRFRYTPETKQLVLDAKWACQDLDVDHPIHFHGVARSTVNATLACETVGGQANCAPVDAGYTWVAPISNVIWQQQA